MTSFLNAIKIGAGVECLSQMLPCPKLIIIQTNKINPNKDSKQMKNQKEGYVNQRDCYIVTLHLSPYTCQCPAQLYIALQFIHSTFASVSFQVKLISLLKENNMQFPGLCICQHSSYNIEHERVTRTLL